VYDDDTWGTAGGLAVKVRRGVGTVQFVACVEKYRQGYL